MIAMKTYNLMIEWGYLDNKEKLDVSLQKLVDRKIQIRKEISENKINCGCGQDPCITYDKKGWPTIFRKDTLI